LVAIRERNPWRRLRTRLLGWKVRLVDTGHAPCSFARRGRYPAGLFKSSKPLAAENAGEADGFGALRRGSTRCGLLFPLLRKIGVFAVANKKRTRNEPFPGGGSSEVRRKQVNAQGRATERDATTRRHCRR
jgi:hypothetical protein